MRDRAQQSWPALSKTEYGRRRGGLLEVGVLEDHVRRLASELERHALDRSSRALHDEASDLGRPREGDLRDVRVLDEALPDDRALADEHVDDAVGDPGLEDRARRASAPRAA